MLVDQDLLSLLQEATLFLWKDWPSEMQVSVSNVHQNTVTLRGTCPHCREKAVFTLVTSLGAMLNGQRIGGMQCQGCMDYVLGVVRQTNHDFVYEKHYPLGKPDETVATEIPEHIQSDFKEALRCFWVGAYNATAEMCRRALEASCIDLKAPPNKVLEKMIDWLADNQRITPDLKLAAHKVRLGGNRGAHPSPVAEKVEETPAAELGLVAETEDAYEGLIEKISKEHAEAIVDFTRHFFQYVYVIPKQLDKYDFSRPRA